MNSTFPLLLISLFLSLTRPLQAQLPAEKIPAAATLVTRINIPGMLDADVNQALNSSAIMKGLGDWLFNTKGLDNLGQAGIGLQEDAWFYSFKTDSIFYNIALIDLENPAYLDSVHRRELQRISGKPGIRRWQNPDGGQTLFWNDALLVVVNGSASYGFFSRPEVEQRYGIPEASYGTYPAAPVQPVDPGYIEANPGYVEAESAPDPPVTAQETASDAEEAIEIVPDTDGNRTVTRDAEPEIRPSTDSYRYDDRYAVKRRIRDSLEELWQEAFALQHFTAEFPARKFTNGGKPLKHTEALADVWMPHVGSLYASLLGIFVGPGNIPGYLKGIGHLGLHMYADKQALRFDGKLAFEGKQGKELLKFYQKKIDPKLLRYVGGGAIGFAGYTFDMQKYLESMPGWMGDNYAELLGTEEELIRLALDVFSVLLDEKAAAKLMKGDFLLVLNGISEQERAYTGYEYDEETFESKRVEKTKKELVPEGRLMFTTDEPQLWARLFAAAARQELLEEVQPGIFRYSKKGVFPFYFMVYKDIVFAGTVPERLGGIQAGEAPEALSSRQRRLLRRNALSGYFNPQSLAFNLTRLNESRQDKDLKSAIGLLNSMGPVSFTTTKRGHYLQGDLTLRTGSVDDANGFAYLLELIAMLEKF